MLSNRTSGFPVLASAAFWGLAALAFFSLSCNPCGDTECVNGVCEDEKCICLSGYAGAKCDAEFRARYVGQYNTEETCEQFPGQTFVTPLSIGSSSLGLLKVEIRNLYKVGWTLTADVDSTELVFTGAPVSGGPAGTVITGNAAFISGRLIVEYSVSQPGTARDSCRIVAIKK
jgi:hypothetical protein